MRSIYRALGGARSVASRGQALHLAQHRGGVDAAAEGDDGHAGGQVGGGAGAVRVDAEDEGGEVGLAQLLELRGEVVGGPEADDLDEGAPLRVDAVAEEEVREDERARRRGSARARG